MTPVAVGSAGPEHAGLASGILNAARQSSGALGVAAACYFVAIGLTTVIRPGKNPA